MDSEFTVAPGEIVSLYGQGIGPETASRAGLVDGRVPTSVLLAGHFQVNVQVPYEVAGRARTEVRLVYREVPSNDVELEVAAATPEIFTTIGGGSEALALNQDGSLNGPPAPAARGSVVAIFATGEGQTDPPQVTGVPAGAIAGLRASVRSGAGLPRFCMQGRRRR